MAQQAPSKLLIYIAPWSYSLSENPRVPGSIPGLATKKTNKIIDLHEILTAHFLFDFHIVPNLCQKRCSVERYWQNLTDAQPKSEHSV